MAAKCFSLVLGKKIRVTRLDSCCTPPVSGTACSYVVSDGFVRVSMSAEVSDGTEIAPTKADGTTCYTIKTPDSFTRFTVEIEFCQVDPELFEMMSNADPFVDYNGDTSGFVVSDGNLDKRFALELWTGIASDAACEPGSEENSGYFLLPCVQGGVFGDFEVTGDGESNFTLTGAFTQRALGWGVGPYDVLLDATDTPAPLPAPGMPTDSHYLATLTGVAPPPANCGCLPMP